MGAAQQAHTLLPVSSSILEGRNKAPGFPVPLPVHSFPDPSLFIPQTIQSYNDPAKLCSKSVTGNPLDQLLLLHC